MIIWCVLQMYTYVHIHTLIKYGVIFTWQNWYNRCNMMCIAMNRADIMVNCLFYSVDECCVLLFIIIYACPFCMTPFVHFDYVISVFVNIFCHQALHGDIEFLLWMKCDLLHFYLLTLNINCLDNTLKYYF